MKISFTNANPRSTGESFLLKFDSSATESTECILVDSGADVDVSSLLDEDDHLAGILLTHAHSDHYLTLPVNSSEVPIFTSPNTARLLPSVLQANADPLGIDGDIEDVLENTRPVDEWVQVIPNVDVRAVPAGHAIGACGFVLCIDDVEDIEEQHILVTGDFTRRPVAGNAGLPLGYPAEIDAVFFNTAMDNRGTEPLTESLNEIVESVLGGGPTLVAADGLVGLQYAHLITGIAEERNLNITIALVGQAASLYDCLDRDHHAITTVPCFDDERRHEILSQNDVCIAGPNSLQSGSSKCLFEKVEDNPCARVVAVGSSVSEAGDPANISRYPYVGHPSRERGEDVVKALHPKEIVIEHGNFDRYGTIFDFGYTWARDDSTNYTLYEDGSWCPPEWVGETTRRRVEAAHYGNGMGGISVDNDELYTEMWPSVEATVTTPEEEGVDLDQVAGNINQGKADTTQSEAKYSTASAEQAGCSSERKVLSTMVATSDGGTTQVGTGVGTETKPHSSRSSCIEQVERKRLVEATEDFLNKIRLPENGGSSDCETVSATVLETEDGELLLQIDENNLDIDIAHQQTVTASIHLD